MYQPFCGSFLDVVVEEAQVVCLFSLRFLLNRIPLSCSNHDIRVVELDLLRLLAAIVMVGVMVPPGCRPWTPGLDGLVKSEGCEGVRGSGRPFGGESH